MRYLLLSGLLVGCVSLVGCTNPDDDLWFVADCSNGKEQKMVDFAIFPHEGENLSKQQRIDIANEGKQSGAENVAKGLSKSTGEEWFCKVDD